ncbi:MAG TPA: hypothetical protein VKA46_10890 [Gemmataceae bacterium]|nr:hypothetical protein [Gemmataceae bacterium]
MLATTKLTPTIATPQNGDERVELANQLFHEFHTRCFWHSPRDLVITEELIPFVVKGLRTHGGRRGFMLAGKLQPKGATLLTPDRELRECR